MNRITVRFFAVFREAAGIETLVVDTEAVNAQELFAEMTTQFAGLNHEPAALVAVNDEMSPWERLLVDGDEVLFFPPVAGG